MKQYINMLNEPNWNPIGIAFIKSLIWDKSNLTLTLYYQERVHMDIWPNFDLKFRELIISFHNVKDFHFNTVGNELHQLSGFDIVDKSIDGLENVNYQILDYEENSIGFYCQEIFYELGESIKIK